MADPLPKLKFDPLTRSFIDEAKARLVAARLVDGALEPRQQEVDTIRAIVLSSTALPGRVRWQVLLRHPVRTWRVRRALRPLRARIRAELALPDPHKPWIEDDEAFRLLLHGF